MIKNTTLITTLCMGLAVANPIIEVFSKEEGLYENNISKPRLYITNKGTSSVSDFKVLYKFTTENANTPVLEDFYTPNSTVSLQHLGDDNYQVVYDFAGQILPPGATLPHNSGNTIGLHYSDWSTFDKSNDFSNNGKNHFTTNPKIEVVDSLGNVIWGEEFVPPATTPVTTEIEVYTKDEGLNEPNMSKPRIFIENTGTADLKDFKVVYEITIESGKYPIVDDYYTPNSDVSIEMKDASTFNIIYDFTGYTLQAGSLLPNSSGNVVGIHYSDWSALNKENDFSNSLSSEFVLNENVYVYDSEGHLIYGPAVDPINYNLTVSAPSPNTWVSVLFDEVDLSLSPQIKISNKATGAIAFQTMVGNSIFINPILFEKNTDYTVELIVDGTVANTAEFSIIDEDPYNMTVSATNKVVKVMHDEMEAPHNGTIKIVTQNGATVIEVYSYTGVYFNAILFTKGETYDVQLIVDGEIITTKSFIQP